MTYFNQNFWRMICGFLFILVLAMGVFYLVKIFDRENDPIIPENNYAEPSVVPVD